ncbi:hypothetical protein ACEUZ9_000858 [Paracoccus litorisediminis]|uniref:hypothetical protein n=1 Tax=Paracoccus litorisediminis TaxID=2006130 RepID=UPI00372DDECD
MARIELYQSDRIPGESTLAWLETEGTGWKVLCRLSDTEAWAIAGPHNGIEFGRIFRPAPKDAPKLQLEIEKVSERAPGTRAWCLRLGGKIITRRHPETGDDVALRIDDDAVTRLLEVTKVGMAGGAKNPDWQLRRVEELEDAAFLAERSARLARERATVARETWKAENAGSSMPMEIEQ